MADLGVSLSICLVKALVFDGDIWGVGNYSMILPGSQNSTEKINVFGLIMVREFMEGEEPLVQSAMQ
jgi:hypothetical protein